MFGGAGHRGLGESLDRHPVTVRCPAAVALHSVHYLTVCTGGNHCGLGHCVLEEQETEMLAYWSQKKK